MEKRRIVVIRDIVFTDPYGISCTPVTRIAAAAVIKNPFAGGYKEDLAELFDIGAALGESLMGELTAMLPGPPVSYGKAALVGTNGDMEHGGALIHPRLGKPMRAALGGGKALIPSNVKIGSMGSSIDVPLGHKDEAWSFAHFDTFTVTVPDAPLPDEIVMFIAIADGGRINPRVGDSPITD
ncbi:MAG: peptide synthetase [Sneathiella sp.]|uniref:amino acid synthesis family protein n=1 Tax=Sneathiella sp. TaxID=1964365 RepID=UPI000C3F4C10|nr:amino acid synthesis family protein [Sneathiella sp.]MAZ01669.1 peptide synthetase [Sneathiella sp.]|tara:strand:+ start:327 stop:872 length:546 start_codon:yes stop_codon:yes gene_type:complete